MGGASHQSHRESRGLRGHESRVGAVRVREAFLAASEAMARLCKRRRGHAGEAGQTRGKEGSFKIAKLLDALNTHRIIFEDILEATG